MNYQKNDILTVTIEDMGHDGEGIGKADGYTLFVKDAIIGDVIEAKIMKAKKNYAYARLMRILKSSPAPGGTGLPDCAAMRRLPAANDGLSGAAAVQAEENRR